MTQSANYFVSAEGTETRRSHQLGIFPDRARAIFRLSRLPALGALGQLRIADIDRDLARHRIQGDDIAVLDMGDRAADRGLGTDMADAEAARGA